MNNTMSTIHNRSITAATYLETADQNYFTNSISASQGKRYIEPGQQSCSSTGDTAIPIGITAKKLQDLQLAEFHHRILKYRKIESKSPFNLYRTLGSFVTPILKTQHPNNIVQQFHTLSSDVTFKAKRSEATTLKSDLITNDYLSNEAVVAKELDRLLLVGDLIQYKTRSIPPNNITNSVNAAAMHLVRSESEKTVNNGKYILGGGLALATATVAWKYFSK